MSLKIICDQWNKCGKRGTCSHSKPHIYKEGTDDDCMKEPCNHLKKENYCRPCGDGDFDAEHTTGEVVRW